MENKKPSVFVHNYQKGVERVKDGNYAFLMESTMLDYVSSSLLPTGPQVTLHSPQNVQRDCNLTQIGGLLDSKG
jgi:ionotropic kainate glutamate receptor 2